MSALKRSACSLVALPLCIAMALAAGCGPAGDKADPADGGKGAVERVEPVSTADDAGQIQINWIGHWKGEEKREDLVYEVKKDYEFLHPNVKINLVFNRDLEGSDPAYKKRAADAIIKMVETGEMVWDIVYLDIATYEHVAEHLQDPHWVRKHIVDFSGVPGFVDSQKDFIVQDPRYKEKLGGILTGPFIESYMQSMWYNTEVAVRAGLAIRERDMTFDDLLGYAEKLQRYNRDNGTSISFIKLSSWNRIDLLFESLFKSQFDDFQSAVEKTFNEKKKEAFLQTLLAFEKLSACQPVVNPGWEGLTFNDFKEEFLFEDDALFIMAGTFMYSNFRGLDVEKSEKMRPLENPVMGRANGLIGDYTPTFAVMKNSANRDVAVDFLMSWATPKNADKWVRYTKNLTGTRGHLSEAVSREINFFDDIYEQFIMDMENKYRGTPMMYMRTPTYVLGENNPVSITELRKKLAEILEGKLGARDYFDDVMRRLEESRK
jgi:ABC-type glycerol-3-phosphate transport system substrate-binding protein